MLQRTILLSKTALLLAVTVSCVTLSSCHHNNDPEEQKPVQEDNFTPYESVVEMGAYILQEGDERAGAPHRVHLGEDNTADHSKATQILWTEGDEVACWGNSKQNDQNNYLWAPYVLTNGANTTRARFQGKAVHIDDNVQGQLALNIAYAIFPLSATDFTKKMLKDKQGKDSVEVYDKLYFPGDLPSSIYFNMPSIQVYQDSMADANGDLNPTFGPQYNVMTGRGNGTGTTSFQSACGVLMLRMKGSSFLNSIYSLKIVSNTPEDKLWGKFTAAINNDASSEVLPESGGDNALVLNCFNPSTKAPLTLPTDAYINFYFVLPPGVFTSGFAVHMDTDGKRTAAGDDHPENGNYDNGTITTGKNNVILQNKIRVMPALELTENITLTWDLDDLYEQGTVNEF